MAYSRGMIHVIILLASALLAIGTALASDLAPEPDSGDDPAVSTWVDDHLEELLGVYRDLHSHPELSLQEERTAGKVAAGLRSSGYAVSTGVGGHGVVGVLENGRGPVVLLRGDMDALPVIEETGLSYASQIRVEQEAGGTVGVMHACGHDVHTTNLIGTARMLADLRELWTGTLVAIAQPAEELGKGARMMIDAGLFERFPRPDAAIALHVWSDLPAGQVATTSGYWAANVDSVDVTIRGRGGHGARPHQAVDPILVSAHLITALQTLVSRRVNPIEPAVVTVGSIHGGSKHNIIPNEVRLQLTVRSYSDEVREQLLSGIRQIAEDSCRTFGCLGAEVTLRDEHTPAAYNDPALTAAATDLFRALFGSASVQLLPQAMGGEDFGLYSASAEIPGLLFRLGAVDPERIRQSREPGGEPLPSLHSSRFAPLPEPTLRTGLRAMGNLALSLFPAR